MDRDIRLSHPALSCLRHSHFMLGGYEGDQGGRMSEANEPRSGRKSPSGCFVRGCISNVVLDTCGLKFFHASRSTGYDEHGTAIECLECRYGIFGIFIIA